MTDSLALLAYPTLAICVLVLLVMVRRHRERSRLVDMYLDPSNFEGA